MPLRVNAPTTIHQGIELSANASFGAGFSVRGNLAINDNTFDQFIEYVPDWANWGETLPIDTVNRAGNFITGSPKNLANLRLTYDHDMLGVTGHLFHAGRQYIDNSNSAETSIDPYTIVNLRGSLKLGYWLQGAAMTLFVQVNNLFDTEYETGGYIDAYPLFLPAAKRNLYAGIRASL